MPHDRFYSDSPLEGTAELEGAEFHHLAHVLRVAVGEEVELVNGKGVLARAAVERLGKESARLRILSAQTAKPPQPAFLLGLPFLRMNRLETALEKGTELGADAFLFFAAARSEKGGFSLNRLERLRHLAVSAMKQSGRLFLPEMKEYSSLEMLLDRGGLMFFGDTDPDALPIAKQPSESILFVSGPESGFADEETALLKQRGIGVRLHANILRAETAPLAALAILSYLYR